MHLFKLTDEQLAQILIPNRFFSPTPPKLIGKSMDYVFDSDDKFELTYDELVEIISKARLAGPKLVSNLNIKN
ncbi:hypothetical protein [Acinetobacter soli]